MVAKLVSAIILGTVISGASIASSISYSKVKVGMTVAHTVTIDLSNPEIKMTVALAKGGVGKSETFKSMISRTRPAAAITGTFYDTKTYIPTGDIALFGTQVHSGCIGSALCIDADNKAIIVPRGIDYKNKWAGYETVLCAGPTLVANGKIAIALKHEGFRPSLYASTRRTAVGITRSGKLMFVAIDRDASLHSLAKLLINIGIVDALCLDGGSSTAFYSNGKYLAVPSRKLTNCLVVYSTEAAYQNAKTSLAPAKLFAKAEGKSLDTAFKLSPVALLVSENESQPRISVSHQ